MKKLILLLLFIPLFSFGQTYYKYAPRDYTEKQDVQSLQIKCNGYTFVIYNNKTPLEFTFVAGDDISYDYSGRVSEIGDIDIRYDYSGRVSYIGNVRVSYGYNKKIESVGGMRLTYNYSGKLTGSRGQIGCNW